jgi:hypothetical protein
VITTSYEIVRIVERHDGDGVPMLIVSAEATYSAADGENIACNVETLIYRPVGSL